MRGESAHDSGSVEEISGGRVYRTTWETDSTGAAIPAAPSDISDKYGKRDGISAGAEVAAAGFGCMFAMWDYLQIAPGF